MLDEKEAALKVGCKFFCRVQAFKRYTHKAYRHQKYLSFFHLSAEFYHDDEEEVSKRWWKRLIFVTLKNEVKKLLELLVKKCK